MTKASNKTWFITGASSGLGKVMAEKLLARGDSVVATTRRPGTLDDLAGQHGERLREVRLDVSDAQAIHSVIAQSFAGGRIDVVVSNAAYGLFGAAEELTDAQIEQQIATNLIGSIQVIRASLPHMRAQGGGRIVQVSSEGGQIAYPGFALYHATKWGIEGFVEAVRQEVEPFGIDFLIVEPGPTVTNFSAAKTCADALDAYADTPAGAVRRLLLEGGFPIKGDAGKTVDAMIAAAGAERPALRLALGSSAYEKIRLALGERLRAIEAQKAVALSADAD